MEQVKDGEKINAYFKELVSRGDRERFEQLSEYVAYPSLKDKEIIKAASPGSSISQGYCLPVELRGALPIYVTTGQTSGCMLFHSNIYLDNRNPPEEVISLQW